MNKHAAPNPIVFFFQAVRARAFPRIWGMLRLNSWIAFEIVIPLITMTAFVYLYRAMHAPAAYTGFLILGSTMTSYWHNVVWAMGSQLHWEKRDGTLELYVLSPAPLMAILVGMSIGGIFQASIRAVAIGIIGLYLFEVQVSFAEWYKALLLFALMLTSLYGLGMMLASLFLRWGREGWQLALALHEPVYFLTGLNFPLSRLFRSVPMIVAGISAMIPISLGLDGLRQLLFPGMMEGVLRVRWELGILAVLAVIYIVGAHFVLRYMEKLSRIEATLSLRWQ